MPVELKINGEDGHHIHREIRALFPHYDSQRTGAPVSVASTLEPPCTHAAPELGVTGTTAAAPEAAPVAEPAKRTRKPKEAPAAPAPQPEPAEVQAQDAADEAAEEGTDEPDRVYTIDDVRRLAGDYTKKFGLPAAQEDGKRIFEKHGHKSKLSDMTDPNVIAAVVRDFEAALNDNIFARKEVA